MAELIDIKSAWEPFRPENGRSWTVAQVGHLYRRTGFGVSAAELDAGLKLGPQATIDRILAPKGSGAGYDEPTEQFLEKAARKFNTGQQAAGWWLHRMLHTPHPLREKLTLFWHNHFATSNAKVQNVGWMVGQYETLYRHALGKFDVMLQDVSKDPAMMLWLDTIQSKKGMPNENYARELMELFSLGIGNYTEKDIREAARAFTGWEIRNGTYFFNESQYDATPKSVLGKSGAWRGEDIVRICLAQKACAKFIVRKLYRFLISESEEPTDALLEPLTTPFAKDFNIARLVETMIRSRHFFSDRSYRCRIKSPVDYVLGAVRALGGGTGTLNGSVNLTAALETLGQNVFHPPSVKGWDGGTAWLNGQTLLFRQNLSLDLARRPAAFRKPAAAWFTADAHGAKKPNQVAEFYLRLLLQDDVAADTRKRVIDYAESTSRMKLPGYWTADDAAEHRAVSICHLIMTLPEYQLD